MTITRPALESTPSSPPMRVTPQDRHDAAWAEICADTTIPTLTAFVCRQAAELENASSVDQNLRLEVRELRYPGHVADVIDPEPGRWAYVVHLGRRALVAEARVAGGESDGNTGARWQYRVEGLTADSLDAEQVFPLESSVADGIELLAEEGDGPNSFGVFLSSLRLSSAAMRFVLDSMPQATGAGADCAPLVRPGWLDTSRALALVPEPFDWSAEAHDCFYLPAASGWIDWVQDATRQSELFIASALKQWIDGGLDQIANNLRSGEPDRWLRNYRQDELRLRRAAEEGACYLVQTLDSPEHRAVEIAAMDLGEQSLSEGFQQWGVVVSGLMATQPGREYCQRLVSQDERLPMRYLFTETPPANALGFAQYRYAFIAAKETFGTLVPAWIELRESRMATRTGDAAIEARDATRRLVQRYLEHLLEGSGDRVLRGTYRTIYANLADGRGPTAGASGPALGRLQRSWAKLERRAGAHAFPETVADIADAAQSADRPATRLLAKLEKLSLPVAGIFEIANLVLAINDYRSANAEQRDQKLVSLVGASADMSVFVTAVVERFVAAGARSAVTGIGGSLAMVAGVCEMLDHERSLVNAAYGQNNYGSAVGSGIAATGAAITVIGGGMTLAWSLAGGTLFASSAGGPVGLIVGAIGAVLILAGSLIATLLSRDPYETFAEHCFLGDSHDDDCIYPGWSVGALPTRDRASEAQVLLGMMSAFSIERDGLGSPWPTTGSGSMCFVKIKPGYLEHGARIDVEIDQKFGTSTSRALTCRYRIDETSDRLQLVDGGLHGLILTPEGQEIRRRENGSIEWIRLNLRPAWITTPGHPTVAYADYSGASRPIYNKVRVRVRQGTRGVVMPPGLDWVEANLLEDEQVSSFETDRYRTGT